VVEQPAFIGLYGIACPTASRCEAVGYDNSDDADAVTTVTNGVAGPLQEVAGGGEWLNAISCWSSTQCDAVGLVNYVQSFVPISNGVPEAAIAFPAAGTPMASTPRPLAHARTRARPRTRREAWSPR
jgi:hypothetical protein